MRITSCLLSLATLTVAFANLPAQAETVEVANLQPLTSVKTETGNPTTKFQFYSAVTKAELPRPILMASKTTPIPGKVLTDASTLKAVEAVNPDKFVLEDTQRPISTSEFQFEPATTKAHLSHHILVASKTTSIPGKVLTDAAALKIPTPGPVSSIVAQAGTTTPDNTTPGTTTPDNTTPTQTTPGTTTPDNTTPTQTTPSTTTPDNTTPTQTTPDNTTPSTTTPSTTTPNEVAPSNTTPGNTTEPSNNSLSLGRATRSGRSYFGIGGNIGIGTGDTAIGDGSFAIISKLGLTRVFSFRPSLLTSGDVTLLLPITYDVAPIAIPGTSFALAPYVGIGPAITFTSGTSVDLLLTGGVDLPLTSRFTATAAVNASVTGDAAVGLTLGIGYNF